VSYSSSESPQRGSPAIAEKEVAVHEGLVGVYTGKLNPGENPSSVQGETVPERKGLYTSDPGSRSTSELESDKDRRRGEADCREPGESLETGMYESTSGKGQELTV
jgi:hypothetical protein